MKLFKNRVVLGITCLILALVVGFVAVPAFNALTSSTVKVVTAISKISVGTQITADMLTYTEMSKKGLPEGTFYNIDEVVNLYALDNIPAGYYVSQATAGSVRTPEGKVRSMNSDEYAITIELGNSTSMKLLPNDIISIYQMQDGKAQQIPELSYVSVIVCKTDDDVGIMSADQAGVATKMELILTQRQLATLKNAQQNGMFIALKYRGTDATTINNYIAMQNAILNRGTPSTTVPESAQPTTVAA